MSARAIVMASLDKAAEFRTTKNGNSFATFAIRENANGKTRWWRVISFAEDVLDALKEMAPGTPISVAGEIDAEIWSPPGSQARINWRLTCDALLSAKATRRPKAGKALGANPPERRNGRMIAASSWAAPPDMGGAHADAPPF
jgi:hypothetical protein